MNGLPHGILQRWLLVGLVMTGMAPLARGDALVVSQAMKASTIAEIFIETNRVRVELEIGMGDLEAFGNLLPDDLYVKMNAAGPPQEERLRAFFELDFPIRPDHSAPLPGRVEALRPRQRVLRDEITGEPLPVSREEKEEVLSVSLIYPWTKRPDTLSFQPPLREKGKQVSVDLGFVVYHLGLMVNDFRPLRAEETLHLDWEDPWYSKFDNRNIKRRFDAPLSVFLYVDPFEVRQEIVARPRDLQVWTDLGLAGKEVIAADDQAGLMEKAAAFLAVMNPVTIDGRSMEPVLDRIHFIQRTARQTRVLDPPEDLPLVSATLGVIFSYPVTGMPRHVFMEWELFSERIREIPASASDEAGVMPATLNPEKPILEWKNYLLKSSQGQWVGLAQPPAPLQLELPALSLLCGLMAAALGLRLLFRKKRDNGWRSGLIILGLAVIGLLAWPMARIRMDAPWKAPAMVDKELAREVMLGLLKNIYRAFDYRQEERIYDVLARSVSGDLLTRTYLETRKSLELENQGGARAKVKQVELMETTIAPLVDSEGFTARCVWNVTGTVGHWGHFHQRRNQYEAQLIVEPVDGAWKLTGLELLSEQRL